MTIRALAAILLLVSAAASGCGDARQSTPVTGPSPVGVAPALQSLYGYVGDTASRPVSGATVEVLDGPQVGTTIVSDDRGLFSYTGTFTSPVSLRASKEGYFSLTNTTHIPPGGRPWVTFQLELVASPVNIAGDYTLTFVVDPACVAIPDDFRRRQYSASIAPVSDPTLHSASSFILTAGGATFLGPYNSFPIGVAGDYVTFSVYNGEEDSGLVEQIAPTTYLKFSGSAAATLNAPPGASSSLSMPFDGTIELCVSQTELGEPYDCASHAVGFERCPSRNHRLILIRR